MSKRSDTDKAIRNLMNWAERPEWAEARAAAFSAHLAPVLDRLGIAQPELDQIVVEHGYGGMLFGMMFEDFVTRRLPDGRNVIDAYLERRGWRESVLGRRYLEQLRDSLLSLYEVVEVVPGRHCDLRDLVRNGDIIRVHERLGTQNLVRWDRVAGRVLKMNGIYNFSGGILPFPQEAAQSLLKVLAESRKHFGKELSRIVGKSVTVKKIASEDLDALFLRETCPAFTSIWLMHTLGQLRAPLPELVNYDGETLMFGETRFQCLPDQAEIIAARLDAAPEWERDPTEEYVWLWFAELEAEGKEQTESGITLEALYAGQRPISGMLELKSGMLILHTNSIARMDRGKQTLELLLQGLVGPALSKIQTPEQAMAGHDEEPLDDDEHDAAGAIDPESAAEMSPPV